MDISNASFNTPFKLSRSRSNDAFTPYNTTGKPKVHIAASMTPSISIRNNHVEDDDFE